MSDSGVPAVAGRQVVEASPAVHDEGRVEVATQVLDEAPAPRQPGVERAGPVGGRPLVAGHRHVPVADELTGVALEPVHVGRPVGVGHAGDDVEHDVRLAGAEERRAPGGQDSGRIVVGACSERAAHGRRGLVVVGEPGRRGGQRGGARVVGGGRRGDDLPQQGVDPEPRAPAAGCVDHQAPPHQPGERGVVAGPQGLGQLGGEAVEDREPHEQVACRPGLAGDHLLGQVVVDHTARPAQAFECVAAVGRIDASQGFARQAHGRGPPCGHGLQLGREPSVCRSGAVLPLRHPEHLGRLGRGEGEVGGRELGEQPLAPHPGDGERDVAPRRHHHVQRRRGLAAQRGEEGGRLGGPVEHLDVVEDEDQRTRVRLGHGRADPPGVRLGPPGLVGARVGAARAAHRGDEVGRQAGHAEAERVGDRPDQRRQRAVARGHAVPRRHGVRRGLGPVAEQGGLAEARPGHDAGQAPLGERGVESLLEGRAADRRRLERAAPGHVASVVVDLRGTTYVAAAAPPGDRRIRSPT